MLSQNPLNNVEFKQTFNGCTIFCMSGNSFPFVPSAALKRVFSVSVQKSLPRERMGRRGGRMSQGAMKNNKNAYQEVILQCMTSLHCQVTQPPE